MNDEEPRVIEKTFSESENQEPIPETSRNPENSQDTTSQNSPQTPKKKQKLMHKKQKNLLTQGVKNTIYAQTPTLTTQTHRDIKKTKYGDSKTSTKYNSFRFIFFLSKIILFFQSVTK